MTSPTLPFVFIHPIYILLDFSQIFVRYMRNFADYLFENR